MPLKIYLPNGDEATWESEMLKVSRDNKPLCMVDHKGAPCPGYTEKADHQHERMSIDDKMKQIFPRLPHEVGDAAIEAAKAKYYREQDIDTSSYLTNTQDWEIAPGAKEFLKQHPEKPEAPAHYAKGGIETIDYIRAKLSPEEYCGYCRGNVMKYISRYTEKGGLDDLRKLLVYAGWLVEAYEKRLVFPHKVVE